MAGADGGNRPQLSFRWDWGCGPFWCGNDAARATFGGDPVEPEALGVPASLAKELARVVEWHDTSLNWDYPPDPGPWRQDECDRFNSESRRLFESCRELLGDRVELTYAHPEIGEDPQLAQYLTDPGWFTRADVLGSETPRFTPRMSAPLPTGWAARESVTLIAGDGQANVIASSEPLDPSIDTTHYATVQGDLLAREFPGFRQLTFAPTRWLGDRQGYLRRFEWQPPDGLPVTQLQLYYVEAGRGYTATATVPTALLHRYETMLVAVLRGVRIDPPRPPANSH
jgi:hypothetical protein